MSLSKPGGEQTQVTQVTQLARVQQLMQEMQAAITAIERNNLQAFHSALQNQQALCDQLLAMKSYGSQQHLGSDNPELTRQLQTAYAQLAQLNRVYAGVVKRGQRSVRLLSLLYGVHQEGYGKIAGGPASQTLSCEV
jgi:DNA-binding transcriptional regulator YbjK